MAIPQFCRRFKDCPNPNVELIGDNPTHWIFKCMTCRRVQVMVKEKAAEEIKWQREVEAVRSKHSWEHDVIYSFPSKGRR